MSDTMNEMEILRTGLKYKSMEIFAPSNAYQHVPRGDVYGFPWKERRPAGDGAAHIIFSPPSQTCQSPTLQDQPTSTRKDVQEQKRIAILQRTSSSADEKYCIQH